MGNEERRSAMGMAINNSTDVKNSILKRLTAHNHELTDSPGHWVTLLKTCQEIVANQRRLDDKAIALEEYSQTLSDWYQEQLTLAYYEVLSWPMSKPIFLLCIDIEAVPNSHQFSPLFRAEIRPSVALERYFSIRPCNNRYVRHVFDKWLVLLSKYHAEHGSMHVPSDYISESGERLGQWVSKTKAMYENIQLSVSEIQRLKRFGFPFGKEEEPQNAIVEQTAPKDEIQAVLEIVIEAKAVARSEIKLTNKVDKETKDLRIFLLDGFDEFSRFIKSHGISKPPVSFKAKSGFKLGLWCKTMKVRYQKGLHQKFPKDFMNYI